MQAFKGTDRIKQATLEQAITAAQEEKIQAWINKYDETTQKGAPFATLFKSADYERAEEELGIPLPVIKICEAIHSGFAKYPMVDGAYKECPAPGSGQKFVSFLKAVPTGADLSTVPTRFLIEFFEGIVESTLVAGGCSDGVKAIVTELAKLCRESLNGEIPDPQWAKVRKAAVALTDDSNDGAAIIAYFAETVAWDPRENAGEIPAAITSLIHGIGGSAHQAAHSKEESTALSNYNEAMQKLADSVKRKLDIAEIRQLPEWAEIQRVLPPARQAELATVATDHHEKAATFLYEILIKALPAAQ